MPPARAQSDLPEALRPPPPIQIGQTIDDLSFTTTDGIAYTLDDIKAPVVLLHYWASWCGPCLIEFPHLLETLKEMDGQIVMIAISLDYKADAMQRYITSLEADDLPIYWVHDTEYELSFKRFQIAGTPETIFLGPKRTVLKKVNDEYDWRARDSWKELTAMISGSI